jgi:4a-hydroxytetrahydrobiopterin dehydratase
MKNHELAHKKCKPCEGGTKPLSEAKIRFFLRLIPGWKHEGGWIAKTFSFKNFHHTMTFVNSVAWVANHENHHPDLEVSYKTCRVKYKTHAINGISENDFICAAKIEQLVKA